MKPSQIKLLALAVLVLMMGSGCIVNRIRAKYQLNECARSYKEGKFAEAEEHAKRSLELNPEQKNADLFYARSIHAQFKPGVDKPENQAIAERAIEAYQVVLGKNPDNEEASSAVGYLLGQLKQDAEQKKWITDRATNESVSAKNRANAYVFLGSKEWKCSYDVTESPECKSTEQKGDKLVFVFKRPKNPEDFTKAQQCVARGQELIEKAVALDPENDRAWGFKTNLLLERRKLAQMEGKNDDVAKLGEEADKAQAETNRLNAKRKAEEEAKASPTPAQ